MDLVTATPSRTRELLRDALDAKQPILIHGTGGIGKSMLASDVAYELYGAPEIDRDSYFIDFRGSLRDPVDVAGDYYIDKNTGLPRRARPVLCPGTGAGLVFLDELNRAIPMVQNALFEFILDRRTGEHRLGDGWSIAGACNPEGVGISRMAPELGNRFFHVNMISDFDDWRKWAVPAGVSLNTIAFISYQPQLLDAFMTTTGDARPTPRSWVALDKAMSRPHNKENDMILASGHVGQEAAVKYLAFIHTISLVNLDAILLDPANALVPSESQIQYATAAGLAARAKVDNFGRVLTYLDRMPGEFAVFAVKTALRADDSLSNTQEFTRWAIAHSHEF